MNTPTTSSGSSSPEAKRTFTAAARFVGVVIVAALTVLGLGVLWVDACRSGGAHALARCSAVQRNFVAIGSPLILLAGSLGAFVRTIQIWRERGRWWIWHGAGWFLLTLTLVAIMMTTPAAVM